ncbi:vWA domain-containing protein [Acidovorax temperans]|uniref:vWA domain-containing protein n=1 Tax=Acidovorax temperans TaxID=80878 RepID=UPI001A93AA67|nr:VWA domain-containing protein [Acidovorax temperans]MBO0941316.1 VWA domain-containing protein [Acidovorax temperans]WCT23024.1 VWA domain-containing protein [Acidovorax temperans]
MSGAGAAPVAAATGWTHGTASQLGDARSGKLADNLTGFGRALRRAGVPVDAARMALAQQALLLVGLARQDMAAALEAVLISREQDRQVFRELFAAYFRNPDVAQKLLAQMLPTAPEKSKGAPRRQRVADALAPLRAARQQHASTQEQKIEFDAAMTASDQQRLRRADFNQLTAGEYQLVQRLVCEVALPLPRYASRRTCPGSRGSRPHWAAAMRRAARTGGELLELPRLARRDQPVPLLVLVDVSGSMERYARLLLTFLHAATARGQGAARNVGRRDVFAFGTGLTDLTPTFRHADGDAMLAHASAAITDFAGGTRLGEALHQLRRQHARRLVGRRTLVLLISDGLDTGEPAALLQELGWLRRHCGQLMWLNPLLRYEGYRPTARGAEVLHRHAHGMLAVHNLESLQQLARSIAAVLQPQRRQAVKV